MNYREFLHRFNYPDSNFAKQQWKSQFGGFEESENLGMTNKISEPRIFDFASGDRIGEESSPGKVWGVPGGHASRAGKGGYIPGYFEAEERAKYPDNPITGEPWVNQPDPQQNLNEYLNNVPSRVKGEFTSAAATSSAPGNLELNVVVPAAAPEEALNLPWVAKVNAGLNQYEIRTSDGSRTFQSYKHRIVYQDPTGKTYLDRIHWCFSSTTSKYRCLFLNEDRKTTQAKIDNGEYTLVNLNPGRAAATK